MPEDLRKELADYAGLVKIERFGETYYVTPEAAESIERMDRERDEKLHRMVDEELGRVGFRVGIKAIWRSLVHRLKIALMCLGGMP